MFKELAEYISNLAVKANETEVKEINGDTYVNGSLLLPRYTNAKSVNSLLSVVNFVKQSCKLECYDYPLYVSVTSKEIEVYSELDKYMKRNEILFAKPTTPEIKFNRFLDLEEFIIQLQTCFVETENKRKLLELMSNFVESDKVEVKDNGIGQNVVVEKNTGVKTQQQLEVNPLVNLVPYRTYQEVEQPTSMFLLRLRPGNQVALFEADGGKWKLDAQYNISEFMRANLKDLIDNGKVIVIG